MTLPDYPESGVAALEVIRKAEAAAEAEIAHGLRSGELGIRGTGLYGALAEGINQLSAFSSCRWGCRSSGHFLENVVRRVVNGSLAVLRLGAAGYYDESLALIRVVAETVNLLQLLRTVPGSEEPWITSPAENRRREYSPVRIRLALEAAGQVPVYDERQYAVLCEAGVHITPGSSRQSHDFSGDRLFVGPRPSIPSLLMLWTELGYALRSVLTMVAPLVPEVRQAGFGMTADALDGAIGKGELRITNYDAVRRWFINIASAPAGGADV